MHLICKLFLNSANVSYGMYNVAIFGIFTLRFSSTVIVYFYIESLYFHCIFSYLNSIPVDLYRIVAIFLKYIGLFRFNICSILLYKFSFLFYITTILVLYKFVFDIFLFVFSLCSLQFCKCLFIFK